MNSLLILVIVALISSPVYGDDSTELKKQDKRGVVPVGYGSHYPGVYGASHGWNGYPAPIGAIGAHGLTGYAGYGAFGGFGHGYLPNSIYPYANNIAHGAAHHGIAAAPTIAHTYSAPAINVAPYNHAYNNHHAASVIPAAAWRVGYNGLPGVGYGHGLNYGW